MTNWNKIAHIFIFFIIVQLTFGQTLENQNQNKITSKRELRGVFLTTIFNLDWPTNKFATPEVQQAELIAILDKLKENNYNTIFFQVRPECDAFYASELEPWSYRLTGKQGIAPIPFWDPLAFAINEAHKRGLDLHAWINPFRANFNAKSYLLAENHVINKHPDWILSASNDSKLKFLNPGIPAVQNYIKEIVTDIATRYDIEGIHFDDYFYPDKGMTTNQDKQTFLDFNPTNIKEISDWRRNNVNTVIAKVYDILQEINLKQNKNIVFGVSPIGIWKSNTPEGVKGNPSFSALYCDPIAWLENGKIDYLAPQLYWKTKGLQDYIKLSQWWNEQVKSYKKQLYISQALYRIEDVTNWPTSEIQNQINHNRSSEMDITFGQIFYRYETIKNNRKKINSILKLNQFAYKTFPHPIFGKDNILPNKPLNIKLEENILKWETPTRAIDNDLPEKYVVYAFNSPFESETCKNDSSKIIDIVSDTQIILSNTDLETKHFTISSLDKNNNENADFSNLICLNNFITSEKVFIKTKAFLSEINKTNQKTCEQIEVLIFNAKGEIVFCQDFNIYSIQNEISFSLLGLKKGKYFGEIYSKNEKLKVFKISLE